MNIKTLVSVAALTAALAISAPAFAQTMVGGVSVSEADLPKVKTYCEELSISALNPTDGADEAPDATGDAMQSSETAPAPNGTDQALTTADLETIDLPGCIDAGIVEK